MRVESREPTQAGRERVAVVADSTEDLWHLQYVIEPGDLVAAEISRRIQRDDDRLRDTGGQRETMHATIEVDTVEFHRFANRLRISGTIVSCSREDQLGHHHTINVEVHDPVELEKSFKPDQRERLREAEEATEDPDVIVVTIEEGRAEVFELAQHGPEHRATVTAGSGKREGESTRAQLFAEVASILERSTDEAIVLAGPGFAKQDLERHLQDNAPEVASRMRTVDTSAIGERGIHEVVQRGVLDEVRTESRLAAEADLIDTFLDHLRTEPDLVVYGPKETARAAEYGAIETLCLLDERLRTERSDEGKWEIDVNDVIEQVEHQGGDVVVFSAEGEPGRQLDSLGGIGAILRYRID